MDLLQFAFLIATPQTTVLALAKLGAEFAPQPDIGIHT